MWTATSSAAISINARRAPASNAAQGASARPGLIMTTALDVARSPGVAPPRVLHGRPLIGCEGFDDPVAIEPANPRVLLAAERTGRQIDHRLIVDVRHSDLHPLGKARTTREIAGNCIAFRWRAGAPRPRRARK
jgi:hypothetical protein